MENRTKTGTIVFAVVDLRLRGVLTFAELPAVE